METRSKREILTESPLFDNLLPTELSMVADLCTTQSFAAGEVVFKEGAVGDALYVIAHGSVEVLHKTNSGKEQLIATMDAPMFFGEMSLIDKEYRSATIRARTATQLLMLTNENLHIFAKNYRNGFTWVVVNIARVLSTRLRDLNQRLAEHL
jgi:CRP/FNR family transcriptional regulator, cyclic AMP receptor protein